MTFQRKVIPHQDDAGRQTGKFSMRHLRSFLWSFALTAILVAISYEWVDRPVAYFVHDKFAGVRILVDLTRIPEILSVGAGATFVAAVLYVLLRRPSAQFASILVLCVISIAVSSLIKDQLKFLFGRTWPETWIDDNPSLIHDGVFGFNFFTGDVAYGAFPSGHMTAICAFASVLWLGFPRYRALWAGMAGLVAVGLIGANYHFVSDVIAGAFVGATTGWALVLLWDAGLPRIGATDYQKVH